MKIQLDKDTRRGRFALALGGRLAGWLVRLIGLTLRVEIRGREHLDTWRDGGRPRILSYWHDRVILSAGFLLGLHRRGLPLTLLASQSRDGELVARMARGWGVDVVRGSATRGGLRALRGVHRAISKAGSSPILIPDGPHGPQYHFKVGVLVLAQTSGAPILPLGFAAERYTQLRSWDRLIVPKPFSRVVIVVGEPEAVDPSLSGDAQEAERQRLETLLDRLTREAEDAVGARR